MDMLGISRVSSLFIRLNVMLLGCNFFYIVKWLWNNKLNIFCISFIFEDALYFLCIYDTDFFISYTMIIFFSKQTALFSQFIYGCVFYFIFVYDNFSIPTNVAPYAFFFYVFLLISSYFSLSFLGLYGVFICNFFGVFCFWSSLLLIAPDFILYGKSMNILFFKWFTMGNAIVINFEFLIDPVSFSFAFLTTSIALFVNIYAFSYFRYEPNVDRLILFLNSFVISMVLLVLSGNLIMLFLGWELIGLTSFLLINFWSTRMGTLKAAFKAYSFNKFSDFLIFVGIIITGFAFNDFNISNILTNFEKYDSLFLTNILNFKIFDLISFFFLGAAFIKSAQVGFHIWLPDSMEAPVPASALIHSATLVSAGIFLILRLYPIFECSSIFYILTPIISIFTAFFGGFAAFYQNDLKRILAYSTISHCGLLMFLTTLGSFEFTLLYLYVHGFFKAIAFLCVGNIIRFNKNYQDVRRMGQLWKYLPYEFSVIFISMVNLSGLPFFFGFCIKHLVFVSVDNFVFSSLVYAILFLAALTGTFYFYKIIFYVFFDTKKSRKSIYNSVNRSNLFRFFYTNSGVSSTISITLLLFTAYLIIFFFFYELVYLNNVLLCFNSTFYKNFSYWLFNHDLMTLFNFGFLNTVVLLCVFLLFYVRWNNSNDLISNINSAFIVLVFIFFFFNLISVSSNIVLDGVLSNVSFLFNYIPVELTKYAQIFYLRCFTTSMFWSGVAIIYALFLLAYPVIAKK